MLQLETEMLRVERDGAGDIFHLVPDAVDTRDERACVDGRRCRVRHGSSSRQEWLAIGSSPTLARAKGGGERGIRTLGRVSPTHAFQACSLNHSDISPREWNQQFSGIARLASNAIVK